MSDPQNLLEWHFKAAWALLYAVGRTKDPSRIPSMLKTAGDYLHVAAREAELIAKEDRANLAADLSEIAKEKE